MKEPNPIRPMDAWVTAVTCARKRAYASVPEAETDLARRTDRGLHIYQCWHCDLFHLGHILPEWKQRLYQLRFEMGLAEQRLRVDN